MPPLGLLTVAAMLPEEWDKKLIDMNTKSLSDEDILWSDYVFLSAMLVQRDSVMEVINQCNQLNRKIVAGGPLFTANHESYNGIDHFVLGEAEITLEPFLRDLENGNAKQVYASQERADLADTPVPMWSLINFKDYSSMNLQFSRGCPFDCEFCDVPFLYGRKPRTKSAEQVVKELKALYSHGWHSGGVFWVDDNFIGNKKELKTKVLPAIIELVEKENLPYSFMAEASINLVDDEELMQLMHIAGFNRVFIGIETIDEETLMETNKLQNKGRDLVSSIKQIQEHGFEVQAGFIIGFDNDPETVFQSQVDFIQKRKI